MMPNTQTQGMQALANALLPFLTEQKHTTPTGTPSNPYVHGPTGLFGVSGLERDIIHTRLQPQGLLGMLPVVGDVKMNPLFPYISGFQSESGTVKDGVCDDPQIAGALKTCFQTAQFGRYEFMTREAEINRIGQLTDRGEFTDLRVVNDPLVNQLGGIMQQQFALSGQSAAIAGADMLMRFIEVGVSFQNLLGRQLYVGNPANNSAGLGYKEFPGLDILIGTTKVDALTGTACPSLRSDIKDMNYDRVDDVNAANNIVNVLTYLFRSVRHIASNTNMGSTVWNFVMRETLFYELTAVWPCNYQTYRCIFPNNVGANGSISLNVDAQAQRDMIDAMRNGRFLIIDSMRIPVVLDDFIVEESSSDTNRLNEGEYASDIYLVPRTVRGGRPVTFVQAFDYARGTTPAIQQGKLQDDFWSDGGLFLWHKKPPLNWCVQYVSKIEPRVILETPHLAGRVTNVAYAPLQHPYFVDGGETTREAPSLYSDWNS
jgi:hypothetical protein